MLKQITSEQFLPLLLTGGGFGLEKESLRVTTEGFLAHTPHPFPNNANIDRDFCENQVELIVPVCSSPHEVCQVLRNFHERVEDTLWNLDSGREYLWPFSNPPYVRNEADIPVAVFTGEMAEKSRYREYLSRKYGKHRMLFSGIHFNYSYPRTFLTTAFRQSGQADFQTFCDTLYLNLAEKAACYSWLIVALTAASPVTDGSFWEDGAFDEPGKAGYSSVRCSELGYWNDFIPVLDYSDLNSYVDSIQRYIDQGLLFSASELYYPIRLKPAGVNQLEHLRSGINHIELRMLDLNPLSPFGIMEEDVAFLHLLLVWMTLTPPLHLSREQQVSSVQNMRAASHFPLEDIKLFLPDGRTRDLPSAALEVLDQMEALLGPDPLISFQRNKILHPELRYTNQLLQQDTPYVPAGLKLAREYAAALQEETIHV